MINHLPLSSSPPLSYFSVYYTYSLRRVAVKVPRWKNNLKWTINFHAVSR